MTKGEEGGGGGSQTPRYHCGPVGGGGVTWVGDIGDVHLVGHLQMEG